jgi:hypothetical protein
MAMVNAVSIMQQCPGASSLTIPVLPSDHFPGEEHVALMMDCHEIGGLQCWDALLDKGVAAVFGLVSGEAELLALIFHAGRFTPTRASAWLAERGFKPILFVPNSDNLAAADFDAPPAAQIGCAVSGASTKGEW